MKPTSLAVIGLGTLGGSLAWQARRAGVSRVIGYAPVRTNGIQALKADAITELAWRPDAAVREADLVVLATPPRMTLDLIGTLGPSLKSGAFLTDTCSIKGPIVGRAVEAGLMARFAGSHLLSDAPEAGFAAARPDRLSGSVVYICETDAIEGDEAARAVAGFWELVVGAIPIRIGAEAHDRQLAWTTHLPHVTASALASVLADRRLAGVSFGAGAKDATRLAGSDPAAGAEILDGNAAAVAEAIELLEQRLRTCRDLLARADHVGLQNFLAAGQAFRQVLDR